ncbi:reverse transcriptase domain-containing protein [Tanacetum coccineum]
MTTRARQEEKVPYLIDLKVEDRVRPCTPIAVRKAQGIRKITLKAKIVKEDTRSLNYEGRSPVSKMTISPNLGSKNGKVGHAKCHMFNSTLTGNARVWFDDLPPESIDSYNDLREAFLKNYLQQKKCIRDPIVLHNIKQRDEESTGDFIQRYKSESGNVKGAPELDEMMQVATSFLQGQEATSNQEMKKAPPAWKHQEGGHRQNFKKGGGFCSQHKQEKRPDMFTLLTKTPREILALEKGKFKTLPPMTIPVEKQNANKFCEFHGEVGHNTDECNHLRRQIEDMLKAGKLSHIIKELKQNNVKDQQKKKGKTSGKAKPQAILMIQSWQKIVRQKISQSFSPNLEISLPSLGDDEGAEGPLIIEAEIGGHQVHRISTSPYNGIIGRPGLRKIHAVPSTTHGMIKFPVTGGILTLRSSKIIPIECAMVSGPEDQPLPVNKVKEERVKVAINPEHPEQTVMIGSNLTEKARVKMCNLLQRSLDVFAWTPADMTGVPRHIAEHRLNVREGCQPIRQKKRGQAAERNIAINDEVSKLVAAGIMREVHYHDWLSNPVMVKKHDDSWRMCVDFKDLNKACPKDGYPLPEIDWKVESLCGFPFKCFLDAYKGYHQIQMAEEDEEKTAFITNQGIFCYTKMPFGLRNAGATYQRLVDKAFHGQIGRNLEVYVDDLVIKSRTEDEIVRDIEETFKTLRKINMKLNPKKCTFGVEEGMFLGYQVNTKGIKICPDKMKEHITKLPMLTAPEEQEELIIYLAASKEAPSAKGPGSKLHLYGKTGASTSTCKQKAKKILPSSSNHSRQVLADFIVERPEEEGQDESTKEEESLLAQWTLFTDGSSCVDGCRAGVILTDPEGAEFTYAL